MIVKLTYFALNGDEHKTVEAELPDEPMWMMATRIKQSMLLKRLPGLELGHRDYHVLVDRNGMLHLVLAKR